MTHNLSHVRRERALRFLAAATLVAGLSLRAPATPPTRSPLLVARLDVPVRSPREAVALVRQNARRLEAPLRSRLGAIGYIEVQLATPPRDWHEMQLLPSDVQFLFERARPAAFDGKRREYRRAFVAVVAVPMIKRGSPYWDVRGRTVVRSGMATREYSEVRDSKGRVVSARRTLEPLVIHASEAFLMVDEKGSVYW